MPCGHHAKSKFCIICPRSPACAVVPAGGSVLSRRSPFVRLWPLRWKGRFAAMAKRARTQDRRGPEDPLTRPSEQETEAGRPHRADALRCRAHDQRQPNASRHGMGRTPVRRRSDCNRLESDAKFSRVALTDGRRAHISLLWICWYVPKPLAPLAGFLCVSGDPRRNTCAGCAANSRGLDIRRLCMRRQNAASM